LFKRLVAEYSRGRVLIVAAAHSAGYRFGIITKEDVERTLVVRNESLVIDRHVEEAAVPVSLLYCERECDHVRISDANTHRRIGRANASTRFDVWLWLSAPGVLGWPQLFQVLRQMLFDLQKSRHGRVEFCRLLSRHLAKRIECFFELLVDDRLNLRPEFRFDGCDDALHIVRLVVLRFGALVLHDGR